MAEIVDRDARILEALIKLKGAAAALQDVEDLDRVGTKSAKNVEDAWKRASDSLRNTGTTLTRNVSLPLAAAGALVLKAGIDAGETVSLINTSLGTNKAAVEAWSKTTVASGVQTQLSLQRTATEYFNLARAMGVPEAKAVDLGTKLTDLSADLASFFNTSVEDAQGALRSGLSGESEPLKRYGIFLDEASIKQEAFTLGLVRQGQEVTRADKAMAIYSLAVKQAGPAVGDLARTHDSAANRMRAFETRVESSAQKLGTALVPAFELALDRAEPLIDGLDELVDKFVEADEGQQAFALSLAAGAIAMGPMLSATADLAMIVGQVAGGLMAIKSAGGISGALGALPPGVLAAGGTVALGVTGALLTWNAVNQTTELVNDDARGPNQKDRWTTGTTASRGATRDDLIARARALVGPFSTMAWTLGGLSNETLQHIIQQEEAKQGIPSSAGGPNLAPFPGLPSLGPASSASAGGSASLFEQKLARFTADVSGKTQEVGKRRAAALFGGMQLSPEQQKQVDAVLGGLGRTGTDLYGDKATGAKGKTKAQLIAEFEKDFGKDAQSLAMPSDLPGHQIIPGLDAAGLFSANVRYDRTKELHGVLGDLDPLPLPPQMFTLAGGLTDPIDTTYTSSSVWGEPLQTDYGTSLHSVRMNDPSWRASGIYSPEARKSLAQIAKNNKQRQQQGTRDAAIGFGTALASGDGGAIASSAVAGGLAMIGANMSAAALAGPAGIALALAAAVLPGLAGGLGQKKPRAQIRGGDPVFLVNADDIAKAQTGLFKNFIGRAGGAGIDAARTRLLTQTQGGFLQ